MKFKIVVFLCSFLSLLSATAQVGNKKDVERPKLVIGLVVDQMRWDYLYRYYDRYTDGGFKRMLNEGFSAENTYINYVPTVTAIGHSTIYTGSVPALHGIAGNDFYLKENGQSVYCTEDNTVQGVNNSNNAGKMSPRNLLTSTITDELKLATNFRSKVIGISLKDRGAILPAGHFADAAYWYDETGEWISSTFYMQDLPKWVKDFNAKKLAQKYLKQNWNSLYPLETYVQSAPEDVYEGRFKGEDNTSFPINTAKLSETVGMGLLRSTPFGNTFTLDMARAAIENENLGSNPAGVTDFLAVSLSSTDYVGHQFAVNSAKVEDTYLRLDQDLASFFQYLDKQFGKGNYTVFLSADHGAAHNPQFFMDHKGDGGYFNSNAVLTDLNGLLEKEFGHAKLAYSLRNYQLHLDHALIKEKQLDEEAIKKSAIKHLRRLDGVAFVADMDDVASASIPSLLKERIINGYNYKRSGDIQVITEAQWFSGSPRATGTSHGTWNPYDSHIPLVFMGWGIKHGATNRATHMTDIAPTIAALLHIEEPNGNIGQAITEITDKKN
ncbi:alkaline phosphatase PafA [Olivibacter sitiensis]|uniref:alkaline phosphatase PafA n=1 Tax=Olivibacter sitiensis TaxID=376470 RepID=UPI00040CB7D8|nr:alkaline phosphatase PafA [Olivibacter sitiensis]